MLHGTNDIPGPGSRAIILSSVSTPEQAEDDKESLDHQVSEGLVLAADRNWTVVDVIRIPGFSRRYYTLQELVNAANEKNEPGPAKLLAHIEAADFDILIVRSTNRLSREQSLNNEIIGKTIRECHAVIFSFMDGLIHLGNYRPIGAITGYRDASDVDELVRKRKMGIVGLAKRGLPTQGRPPWSHTVSYNPRTGDLERMEIRDELVPMWYRAAELFLDGVSLFDLETELFKQYHYANRHGEPYAKGAIRRVWFNALFWGNNVIRWQGLAPNLHCTGVWLFDQSYDPPKGVEMFWNTHEPVMTGDVAEKLKDELIAKHFAAGAGRRQWVAEFSGLVNCDLCYGKMGYMRKKNPDKIRVYMLCSNYRTSVAKRTCNNNHGVKEEFIHQWMNKRLEQWLASGSVDFGLEKESKHVHNRLTALIEAEARQAARLETLIDLQVDAEMDLKASYQKRVRAAKDELDQLNKDRRDLQAQLSKEIRISERQANAFQDIARLGLENFWQSSPKLINQTLRALMGTVRMVASDAKIIGFIDMGNL